MRIPANTFQKQLEESLNQLIATVNQELKDQDEHRLNTPEGDKKWSILQCVKHLSLANQVYVDNVGKALDKYPKYSGSYEFRSHWKGDMFTKMIAPKANDEIKGKMKTFKSMEPSEKLDLTVTLNEFNAIHHKLLDLLKASSEYNMNQVKVPTALGPMVKLRLGDAFRFVLAHAQRHVVQMKRIDQSLPVAT